MSSLQYQSIHYNSNMDNNHVLHYIQNHNDYHLDFVVYKLQMYLLKFGRQYINLNFAVYFCIVGMNNMIRDNHK